MNRKSRIDIPRFYYHITNRGVNKETIFIGEEDYYFFLNYLSFLLNNSDMLLTAFCLMPNHFHLLLYRRVVSLAQFMHRLETNYAIYFNREHDRVGHLYQDRFNSRIIHKEEYLANVINYIHNNPVKDGFVEKPEAWPYSSAGDYLGIETAFQKKIEVPLTKFSKFKEFKDLEFEKDIFEKNNYIGRQDDHLKIEKRSPSRNFNYFNEKRGVKSLDINTKIKLICERENLNLKDLLGSMHKNRDLNKKRNKIIIELNKDFLQSDIARLFQISKARVNQIVHQKKEIEKT